MRQKRLPAGPNPWIWLLAGLCLALTVLGTWLDYAPRPHVISGPVVVPLLFVAPPLVLLDSGDKKNRRK